MQISVSGKNMDTGAAFQTHAEDALNGVVNKYFDRAVSGHVTLEKADAGFRVKTRVALSRRIELEATGYAHNAHAALDAAIEHAEKRLRRHKRRLKNHRNIVTPLEEDDVLPAPMLVYAAAEQLEAAVMDGEAGEMPPHGAYGLELAHKHIPEMVRYAGLDRAPIFMPSVGNFYAGMLVHLPLHAASLNRALTAADIHDVYAAQFGDSPFIRMGAPQAGDPEVAAMMLDASALAGCDHMEIFVFANADESQFWLTARLDNLGKGASGAAVQNMNIALGLDETAGLSV